MTRFFLIRHATNESVGKRLAGRTGLMLDDEGMKQAGEIAHRLRHVPLAAIYSSPLERTMQTAIPLAQSRNLEIRKSDDFLEIDFGEWTNKTFEELKQQSTFRMFNTFRSGTRIPGGESMTEAQTRIVSGIQLLTKEYNNCNIAIISHADMIRAAIVYYSGMPLDLIQRIEIAPASVSIIEIHPETAIITLLNYTGEILM